LWGSVFFLFLSLAALTTVVAVFECLIGGVFDAVKRRRSLITLGVGVLVAILSLPCVLWEGVLGWEDFVFSKFYLPIGGFALMMFVANRFGWGWEKFRSEASSGDGVDLPDWTRPLFRYVVPAMIFVVLVSGLI
jgi:NSS family neurotransmitter:Na+ symporter